MSIALGNALGQGLVEVDKDCAEMVRIDLFWIKSRLKGALRGWGPLCVYDGRDTFVILAMPLISHRHRNWYVESELGGSQRIKILEGMLSIREGREMKGL